MRRAFLDTYHIGDARRILEILPRREFLDVTITSPPYWNLKNYGSRDQIGFGQEYERYLSELENIFSAIHRITKKTGSLWVVADTLKSNGELKLFPFDLAQRLKRIGWSLHDIIVWHKDKTLPWSHRGKLRNIFEYILFFSKGPRFKYHLSRVRETDGLKEWWVRYPERYSPLGKAPTRTWSIAIPRQGSWGDNWVRHFCPFPPELVRRIVLLTTQKGGVVCDPFCGSGVVLAQAKALQRRYVGLDLRKRYRQMFKKRVLPTIVSLENKTSKARLAEEKKKKAFSALIWRLRKTKYPRELVRLYEKKHRRLGARGVLALTEKSNRVNVFLIFPRNKKRPRRLLSRMRALMRRPPLSKYGLQVKVSLIRLRGNLEARLKRVRVQPGAKVGVYTNGRTYWAASQVTAADFLDSLKNDIPHKRAGVPPIASNVRVKVPRKMAS